MAFAKRASPPSRHTTGRATELTARREAEPATAELLAAGGAPGPQDIDLYEADYYVWLTRNAALIRAGRVSEADLENIAEELEDMGRSEKRAVGSHISVLLVHLLKWELQPAHRSSSWRGSIYNARTSVEDLLSESPSLRNRVPEFVADRYRIARNNALIETGLQEGDFPLTCPYTPEQVLDADFWPGPAD